MAAVLATEKSAAMAIHETFRLEDHEARARFKTGRQQRRRTAHAGDLVDQVIDGDFLFQQRQRANNNPDARFGRLPDPGQQVGTGGGAPKQREQDDKARGAGMDGCGHDGAIVLSKNNLNIGADRFRNKRNDRRRSRNRMLFFTYLNFAAHQKLCRNKNMLKFSMLMFI
jgi:hypothetical protein